MDYSQPGSSVHGMSQARMLEWVAISYSRGSSWSSDRTRVSCVSGIGRQILYHCTMKCFLVKESSKLQNHPELASNCLLTLRWGPSMQRRNLAGAWHLRQEKKSWTAIPLAREQKTVRVCGMCPITHTGGCAKQQDRSWVERQWVLWMEDSRSPLYTTVWQNIYFRAWAPGIERSPQARLCWISQHPTPLTPTGSELGPSGNC